MSNIRTYNCGKELRSSESSIGALSCSHYAVGDTVAHDTDRGTAIPSKKTLIENLGSPFSGTQPHETSYTGQSFITADDRQGSLFRKQKISNSFHLIPMGLVSYPGANLPNSRKSDTGTNLHCKVGCFPSLPRLLSRLQNLPSELMARRFYEFSLSMI